MPPICRWSRPWWAGFLLVGFVLPMAGVQPAQGAIVVEESEPLLRLDLPGHTGEVRAMAFTPDSRRLISGGRDKVALVWQLGEGVDEEPGPRERNILRRRARERAIRWQVGRGPRGAIQALAVSPAGDPPVVAVAGLGTMGSTGEILLVDARDGSWVKTLGGVTPDKVERTGHRQSVTALAFTADGSWLISQDLNGQAFAWKRADGWKPVELARREEERLGADGAKALLRMPLLRPMVAIGNDRVALPTLVSKPDANPPVWRIRIVDLARPGDPGRLLPLEHLGVVAALAATPDGRQLVSADMSGQVAVLDPAGDRPPVTSSVKPMAESLAVFPDGKRFAVGVAADLSGSPPRLEIWDMAPLRRISTRSVPAPVRALQASPDGRWLAWSGATDHGVMLEPAETLGKAEPDVPADTRRTLGSIGQQITRVAFSSTAADARILEKPANGRAAGARERNIVKRQQPRVGQAAGAPPRRIAMSRAPRTPGQPAPAFDTAFDIVGLSVAPVGDAGDWAPPQGRPGRWSIMADSRPVEKQSQGVQRWELRRDGRPAGVVDLALDWQGVAGAGGTAVAWLSQGDAAEPWAVAVGTDLGIFVYRLDEAAGAACRLVRWFRGNENRVLSLAVSEDGRWLTSGGGDGTCMVWSLAGIERDTPLTDRWGVSLAIENGRAVVSGVDEVGPLAGRDVRVGDAITRIVAAAGKTTAVIDHAEGDAIRTALTELPWNTSLAFTVERDGDGREFNRNPAWENIATLYLAADREWAFWSPRGYYAASANGDRFFGWLVNRGIDRLPRFYRANQFRRKLERPDVVSRLLVEGSLDAALRSVGRDVPDSTATVLPKQIAQAPEVRILSPRPGEVIQGGQATVRAEITIPDGAELDRVRVDASGVPVPASPRLVAELAAEADQPRRQVLEFDSILPADDQQLISVYAAVRAGPTAVQEVRVERAGVPLRSRDPRLHLIAAGVDRYSQSARWRDMGLALDDLVFSVADARAVRDVLTRRTLELFDVGAEKLMADTAMTREAWKREVTNLVDDLRGDVEPDDLVVIFLAGHGITNVVDGGTYAYLCHDAELGLSTPDGEPVPSGSGAIGWTDLAALADLPCRKLALIDTCHSGALGPGARSVTVREFQENMVVVLAAAADDEASQEADEWGHGAFTKALLEGLEGKADVGGSRSGVKRLAPGRDGIVSLKELVRYVENRVPQLTGNSQNPRSSPRDLVEFVERPLVTVEP